MTTEEMRPIDEAIAHLEYRHPGVLSIDWAGGACPFQAEGTLHGLPFYFRFRGGYAQLRVENGDDNWYQPLYSAGAEHGHPLDGWLDGPEFVELMTRLIGELERAPIYWEFPGIQPDDIGRVKAGEPTTYGAWAHTPEQAWERMHEPSVYLLRHGLDKARQAEMVAARQMVNQTVTVDTRVFPDPEPQFRSPA